jgi:lipid II isoglutaminyl synthase (glutamine-hydrolysing)
VKNNYGLTIGWLYPELMSTYGDRGNIICLTKRCRWRRIKANVVNINMPTSKAEVSACDLIIGGGAQDRQQELSIRDLRTKTGEILKRMFRRGVPGLFVCGSPQLLGRYYTTGDGVKLEGIGLFTYETRHFGHEKPRCIGNTAGRIISNDQLPISKVRNTIVGFENHGGRTYLGENDKPFAKVLRGNGNNGEDGFEGAVYKNVIACYYHGPFLPKNPHVADWLIARALEVKYSTGVELEPLEDNLEWQAHDFMLKRMGIRND